MISLNKNRKTESKKDFKDSKESKLIYSTIFECISVSCHKFLVNVNFGDGCGAWLALLNEFERPSKASKRKLYFELFNLKFKSTESISDYVFRLQLIIDNLKQLNAHIEDGLQLAVILMAFRRNSNKLLLSLTLMMKCLLVQQFDALMPDLLAGLGLSGHLHSAGAD